MFPDPRADSNNPRKERDSASAPPLSHPKLGADSASPARAAEFERALEEGDFAAAEAALAGWQNAQPGAESLAAAVRLHARQDRREAAIGAVEKLCLRAAEEAGPLRAADTAMRAAGWSREAERTYFEAVLKAAAHPETGALWVEHFTARGAWKYRKQLYKLATSREVGRRARLAYLEACGTRKATEHFQRFVERERPWLRADDAAWGTAGYAYLRLGRADDAVFWMEDWRKRTAVAPWMLINLAAALRETRRDEEASEVNRHALELPPDHTSLQHRLWLGLDAACAADPTAAQALLALPDRALNDTERTLHTLGQAVLAVHAAADGEREAVFERERAQLRAAEERGDFGDPLLQRAFTRTLRAMARAAGIAWWRTVSFAPLWAATWRAAAVLAACASLFLILPRCDQRASGPAPRALDPALEVAGPGRLPLEEPFHLRLEEVPATPAPQAPPPPRAPAAAGSFTFELDPDVRGRAPENDTTVVR